MTENVCVIGSNSFSGANFCRHLANNGHQVLAVSRSTPPVDALLPYKWEHQNSIQFQQVDLNHDLDVLFSQLDKFKPSMIFNFAAQSMVGQSWDYPEHWFHTNGTTFSKLINRLKNVDYLERYLHVSTPEVYGSTDGFIKENQPFFPTTPYAISRSSGDFLVDAYHRAYDFPVITTRAANVYGEGQPLYRIIPKTIMSILLGKKLPLHGGGTSRRSFIHMDDVSNATYQLVNHGKLGEGYHISTKRIVSIRELVEMLCEIMKVDFHQQVDISEERLGKDDAYLLNSEKIRSELNWQDKIELEKGLEQTVSWVKDNFEVLRDIPMQYQHKE